MRQINHELVWNSNLPVKLGDLFLHRWNCHSHSKVIARTIGISDCELELVQWGSSIPYWGHWSYMILVQESQLKAIRSCEAELQHSKHERDLSNAQLETQAKDFATLSEASEARIVDLNSRIQDLENALSRTLYIILRMSSRSFSDSNKIKWHHAHCLDLHAQLKGHTTCYYACMLLYLES